ncbi:hypothetical protein PsAD2_01297 [Pseudovibrio axinellae]|uniref:Uncharacterized protein n=1 Tax=Pseudovibrio axinellae TaxID=989403 RepID=A0A166AAX4_9HYPH|nr:DUF1192 domain-containing protein [Pseudovibrio axinellae]KZL20808.1 hypothetical protein PsAD2_01297 [Pseudovibrio axinellae]SER21913.1 Uncharacterized small protein, DUF1192 family [Pseudovibrio axinellae]
MGIFDEDDTPRQAVSSIQVGEPLTSLSIHELNERLERLKTEIARVESEIKTKSEVNTSAEDFFK